jgi:hypothetical protein
MLGASLDEVQHVVLLAATKFMHAIVHPYCAIFPARTLLPLSLREHH